MLNWVSVIAALPFLLAFIRVSFFGLLAAPTEVIANLSDAGLACNFDCAAGVGIGDGEGALR